MRARVANILWSVFLAYIIPVSTAYSESIGFDYEMTERAIQNRLNENDRSNRYNIGRRSPEVIDLINNKYKGYKIALSCEASFSQLDRVEYAFSLIRPDRSKGEYLIVLSPVKDSYQILNIKPPFTASNGQLIEGASLECFHAAEIKRFNSSIRNSNMEGGVKSAGSSFFTVCIESFSESPLFECFIYDTKKKKLKGAGGWIP